MKILRRDRADSRGDQLGKALVAVRWEGGAAPAGAGVIVFGQDGQARRPTAARIQPGRGETAWCWHPGPYAMDLVPFAAAPEAGLRLECVIDTPDPRIERQRFDLFLFSEAAGQGDSLTAEAFAAMVQAALRKALAQGTLDLPPCTSLDEWNTFRAGVNELLYMRFGVTVHDCMPVDLGDSVDFAAMLRARAVHPAGEIADIILEPPAAPQPVPTDAGALRRLFLELPALAAALRQLPDADFIAHQALQQRLALAALDVNTMPTLALAAPGRPLDGHNRLRRERAAVAAAAALDECWSLLAQMKLDGLDACGDEVERVVANLEFHLAARRIAVDRGCGERREPT